MSNSTRGNSRASGGQGRSLDASALQIDMARRFGLPGAAVKRVKYLSVVNFPTRYIHSSVGVAYTGRITQRYCCPSCAEVVCTRDATCTNCGIFFRSIREFEPTLSESRGLVHPRHAPVVALSAGDWGRIESKVWERQEWFCPICMDGFSSGHEVILSCSHMFHRNCLGAFEKFRSVERTCPVCRESNYQKKITHVGSRCFEIHCATRLKAVWLGYRARVSFYETLRTFYKQGGGESHRRKLFYEKELALYSKQVVSELEARDEKVTSLLSSSDTILSEGRELDVLFAQMLAQRVGSADSVDLSSTGRVATEKGGETADNFYPSSIDNEDSTGGLNWRDIWTVAVTRGLGECAVCMCANDSNAIYTGSEGRKRPRLKAIALLSCTHVFHDPCLRSFELYNKSEVPLCPMCRRAYEKKILTP